MTSKLHPNALQTLPLGAIKPRGWLRDQLRVQLNGLSSTLPELWPDIAQSKWIGGEAEGWERGPYWLDGAVPLAFLLDDEAFKARVQFWIDTILERQHEDGWLGEKADTHEGSGEEVLDPWPQALVFKAFIQWHEATNDERIVPAMSRALKRIGQLLDEKPLENWAKMRWPELALGAQWLHGQSGEDWLLDLADKMQRQGYDWRTHFAEFPFQDKQSDWTLPNHVVNNAMALKEPAVRFRQHGTKENEETLALNYIAQLDRFHGQATGVFSGDESLAGLSPSQGTELCAVVEYLFSLEELIAAFGTTNFSERLERIAFNALPATFTADMKAHQYDQQVNQVLCSHAKRDWVSNGDEANLFGLEPNFGCCTSNMHQGWPKFATHLWMKSTDGLVAVAYAPCEVTTDIGGTHAHIVEETEYPFRDTITFRIETDAPKYFALHLPIPSWATNATIQINDEASQRGLSDRHSIEREWKAGDVVVLHLPMSVRLEDRPRGAKAVWRGPLMFGLKIDEDFRHLRGEELHADWEVHPKSPWNYALAGEENTWTVQEKPIGSQPFDPAQAPVEISAVARRVSDWDLHHNSADLPPQSPVQTDEAMETVTLVPFGSTHLRIGEFPVAMLKAV